MDKFTVTGIDFDGSPLFLHLEARDALHAEAVMHALPLPHPSLLLNGYVQSSTGRQSLPLMHWLAANRGPDFCYGSVIQEYVAWYQDPSRLYSPVLSQAQREELSCMGEAAGFPRARLLDEGGYFTVIYTADPNSRFYSDRILGQLRPSEGRWQACLYRPKTYQEQFGGLPNGYRVVSQHVLPEDAFQAILNSVGFVQDVQHNAAVAVF